MFILDETFYVMFSVLAAIFFPAETFSALSHVNQSSVRYYEPVGVDQGTCEEWQDNKKCPEAFSERTWDYHPNGDGSLELCTSICSNSMSPACCYYSEQKKCYSHGLTLSMKIRKNNKVFDKLYVVNLSKLQPPPVYIYCIIF